MRLRHKVPARGIHSDPVTPEYQAEVDRSTNKAMVAYERAQRRLESAERRLESARKAESSAKNRKRAKSLARESQVAAELVELRREELRRLEDLLKASPASSEHRGRSSYRPIPQPGRTI